MDFSYSEEQQMLRDGVARFVQQRYDFESRRAIVSAAPGYSRENWQLFAELGWLTVPFTEDDGGLGGSAVDLVCIMEAFGKGLVIEPFLATAVLGGGAVAAAGSPEQKQSLLAPLMEGRLQLALAYAEPDSRYQLSDVQTTAVRDGDSFVVNGSKAVVLNGESADQLVVSVRTAGGRRDAAGIDLLLVDAGSAGVSRHGYATVDGFRAAEVRFENVRVPSANLLGAPGSALPIIDRVIDRAALAVCAEAVGAMQVIQDKTVEYTRVRKQFGVPIASFQALQHRMSEMYIEYEQARSILLMAAMQLDAAGGHAPGAVSAAKSRIGRAARLVGCEAVQLHGAIAVMDELDVGHYFKRLTTIQFQFGSTDYHTQRFARA